MIIATPPIYYLWVRTIFFGWPLTTVLMCCSTVFIWWHQSDYFIWIQLAQFICALAWIKLLSAKINSIYLFKRIDSTLICVCEARVLMTDGCFGSHWIWCLCEKFKTSIWCEYYNYYVNMIMRQLTQWLWIYFWRPFEFELFVDESLWCIVVWAVWAPDACI